MPILQSFAYEKPSSLSEALKALDRYGRKARPLAGGTDLIGLLHDGLVHPKAVMDLKGLDELHKLELVNGKLHIGALVTFSDLLESPLIRKKFPVLGEMAGWVASHGIRNRATMVGNICSAVPCCDSGPLLLLYEAVVHVRSRNGKRKIPITEWFTGPRETALKKGELAVEISLPHITSRHGACFVKLRRYEGEDLAQASVSVLALAGQKYRIAYGSVGPVPFRGRAVEQLLAGQPLSEPLIQEAVRLAREEVRPITDIRSTREYRTHMIGVMLERGLRAAVDRKAGKGPAYGESLI